MRSRGWLVGWVMVLIGVGSWTSAIRGADWPQWRGPNRDGVWHESDLIERFDGPELTPLWRVEIGSGYCGPTVAKGRVYVTDRVIKPKQVERVHCFDARTGQRVWEHAYQCKYRNVSYDAGPRASVLVNDGRAYSLGTMGHLHCFDAADGTVLWKKNLAKEYAIEMPVWGIAASPVIEGDQLICQIGGKDGACLIGLDKRTGSERWRALDDPASYSAPIVIDQNGVRVLACWTGDHVSGLNPKTGKVYWRVPFKPSRMVIGVATPVWDEDHLLVSSFFDGALLLRLTSDEKGPRAEKVWHRHGQSEKKTQGLHAMITTPLMMDGYIYGVGSYGELRCLDRRTGDRVWESLDVMPRARWATAHMVRQGQRVWLFNERGELIISRLSPAGFEEISRAKLIEPTLLQLRRRGGVCWSHPAFADGHVFARNDEALLCVRVSRDAER